MTLVEFVPPTPHPLWKLCLQMGIGDVVVKVNPQLTGLPDPWRFETLSQIVGRLRAEGLRVVGLEGDPFDMSPIKQYGEKGEVEKVGGDAREVALSHYRELLESMARLDIRLLCYNFMVGTGWARTGVRAGRGGAKATYFSLAETPKAELKLTKEQVWANYEYFIRAVMPTAERCGVRMALHPDDPCLPELGGYARIFETVADYDRAYEICPSPSNAVTYCQANFKLMGADLVETAKHFGKRIAFVHVRDVEGDKTDFTELFHDQGTTDQFALMRTYRALGLDVPVRGDHVPEMEGDRLLTEDCIPGYFTMGRLFANGYLKALLRGARILLALCAVLPAALSADSLEDEFRTPPPGYGEVPFWWWTGEKLDKTRIREQLRELHAKGVSGTQVNYSHLMTDGWRTVPVEPAIFSDEWWDVFNDAALESAKLGMGIGLSGYTLDWPGRDNLYRQLGISVDETRGRVLELKDGKVVPVVRDGTLDPLNPESAKRVIDRFFKPFWDRVPASAHGALNYFFQDELRLSGDSYVWSDDFPDEFRKRKGYDIVPELPLLFAKDVTKDVERVRLDYNDVMVALTEERYFKPIYDWHASRGMIYACDSATRGKNPIEFGDYMRSMRWYTAPGFDTPGKHADPVKCKMGSSISHLYRRPRVWLEGYHSQGWQANTASIFDATAHNYVYGANLLNLHGLYYSTYGGWWEWAPPCYHFHQPYWALMGTTLKYFERLSYMLTRGTHVADVAIVSPQEPCVVDPERANKTSVPLAHALVDRLAVNGTTDCDFIDSDSILNATIEKDADGVALVAAGERYRVLVLPDMFAMRTKVRAKLDDFAKAGGRIIDVKKAEDVKFPLVAQPDVVGNNGLKYHHRRLPDCDIYYLVDWDGKTDIHLRAKGTVEYWDLWTGEKRAEPPAGEPILAVVKKGDATFLSRENKDVVSSSLPLSGPWQVTFLPTLDNKWGDYRLPAFNAKIGPEVRAMRWLEENRTENLTYGPQFIATNNQQPTTNNLYSFSWRYGVFDKPGAQNDHHGLNRVISDYFFVLGRYSTAWPAPYDVVPSEKDKDLVTRYTTYVYAPYDLQAKVEGCTERPQAIFPETAGKYAAPVVSSLLVGDKSCKVGDTVSLKAGYTPVEIAYKGCGRAALVFADVTLGRGYRWPTPLPLAMKWDAQGNRLNYDPFGGKHKKGTFVASVPPGTVDAVVDVNGKLLKKEIKNGELTLEIEFKPGLVGGNAFKDVVKLVTKPAEMELGDWARFEGLRCYSGGAVYRKTVEVPAAFRKDAKRVVLDLGSVGCAAEVAVNGKTVGVRTCPPWTVDVTDVLKDGANDLSVTVYNTLNNHYQTIPTRYKVPTAEAPSGLLGPILLTFRP